MISYTQKLSWVIDARRWYRSDEYFASFLISDLVLWIRSHSQHLVGYSSSLLNMAPRWFILCDAAYFYCSRILTGPFCIGSSKNLALKIAIPYLRRQKLVLIEIPLDAILQWITILRDVGYITPWPLAWMGYPRWAFVSSPSKCWWWVAFPFEDPNLLMCYYRLYQYISCHSETLLRWCYSFW